MLHTSTLLMTLSSSFEVSLPPTRPPTRAGQAGMNLVLPRLSKMITPENTPKLRTKYNKMEDRKRLKPFYQVSSDLTGNKCTLL